MSIEYELNLDKIHEHIFTVKLKISDPNPLGQVLLLPNWIFGSYMIRDFCKNIVSVSAFSGGKQINITKLDKNNWKVRPSKTSISIEYEIYAFDISVRCAYLASDRAFFNGVNLFLLPLGHENQMCYLKINNPPKEKIIGTWSCATTLELQQQNNLYALYSAENYEDLIDHPVEMAPLSNIDFEVAGIKHSMAISGKHYANLDMIKQDLSKICKHHIGFFNNQAPFANYLFLTLVRENDYGGLEHKSSTSLICSRDDLCTTTELSSSKKYIRFLSLCAHEYFHAWWVKKIRPASFHKFDFHNENYTEQLWIFEGFTSYYDELSLLRIKLLKPQQYLDLFAKNITKLQRNSARFKQSLVQSSFEAWTKFYQQDENATNAVVSYYTKGAVFALVLDVQIRRLTNDKLSLDDVLRHIWQNNQLSGTENDTVQIAVEELTKIDFSEFFNDYVNGVKELPIVESFAYLGIDCVFNSSVSDLTDVGISYKKDADFAKITVIFDNTCAQQSGLYVGDKIIAIDSVAVNFTDLLHNINSREIGNIITISVLRDGLLLDIDLSITHKHKTFCSLNLRDNISVDMKSSRNKWFYQ